MKFPFPCLVCLKGEVAINASSINYVSAKDGKLYEGCCQHGHKIKATLDQFQYEILFEIAIQAIIDGYFRDAVSSFTSALERFHEVFVKTVLIRKIRYFNLIEEAWAKIDNQSERQLGAYIFLFMETLGEMPVTLSNTQVSFRNSVIHKGKIPSKEETIQYGNAVLDAIWPSMKQLKEKYQKEIELLCEVERVKAIAGQKDEIQRIALGTVLNLTQEYSTKEKRTVEKIIEMYSGRWIKH